MRPFIKSPRILRTGQPLTLEAIRQVAPAVFAEGPHASRGPRYAYVPTVRPLALRYGSTLPPFPAADLLRTRRDADAGDSLWHVFNRVQENILDGGWETRSTMLGRKSSVKPVERVTAVAGINAGLWDAALALAA